MAVYRVQLDLSFATEDEVVAFANLVEGLKSDVFEGTGSETIPIIRQLRYHKCFHDEVPPKPCSDYTSVDFSSVTKVSHRKEAGGAPVNPNILIR